MLFEFLAHDDHDERIARRKASALAHQRVESRLSKFVRAGSNYDERKQRLALVQEDLEGLVAVACEEVGFGDAQIITAQIIERLVGEPEQRTASVHEARKPKLCPYHKEVMDISLAQGEPRAGFDAMAQHAWSQQHCQGSEYEGGKCNFKREMTTQSYWDEKAEQAEQRRQERDEQRELQQEVHPEPPHEDPAPEHVHPEEHPEEVEQPEPAEQEPVEAEVPMAMAAKADALPLGKEAYGNPGDGYGALEEELGPYAFVSCPTCGADDPRPTGAPGQYRCPNCGSDFSDEARLPEERDDEYGVGGLDEPGSTFFEGPGVQTHPVRNVAGSKLAEQKEHLKGVDSDKRQRQYEHIKEQCLKDGKSEEECKELAARTVNKQRAEKGETKSHTAEALKTIDVEQGEGPSPKIDKRKWTPENVTRNDAEMEGTPHPTRQQDITEPASYEGNTPFEDDGRFEQTDAVLEKQDVEKDGGQSPKKDNNAWAGKPAPKGDPTPFAAAVDPDKNPIRELLEEDYDGFLPQIEVQAAIRRP